MDAPLIDFNNAYVKFDWPNYESFKLDNDLFKMAGLNNNYISSDNTFSNWGLSPTFGVGNNLTFGGGLNKFGFTTPLFMNNLNGYGNYQKTEEELKKEKENKILEYKESLEEKTKEIAELETKKKGAKVPLEKEVSKIQDNKKVGWWNGAAHVGKGVLKTVTNMACDWEDGKAPKFNWKKAALTGAAIVGAGILCATGLGVVVVAAGVLGLVAGGAQAVKGGVDYVNAKTKKGKEKALEDIGEGVGTVAVAWLTKKFATGKKVANLTAELRSKSLSGSPDDVLAIDEASGIL
jgi:hypothetical protein